MQHRASHAGTRSRIIGAIMFIPYVVFGILGAFFGYVVTRPSAFRYVRTLTIPASPSVLFGLINDFHEWAAWSPWAKLDPAMVQTYEGESAGKGAVYRWSGNSKAGMGAMTILESKPDSRIVIELKFIKPFAATNTAIFTLEPEGTSTKVTWAMEGTYKLPAKAFGVFVDMEKLIGKDFTKGLEAMRDVAATKAG